MLHFLMLEKALVAYNEAPTKRDRGRLERLEMGSSLLILDLKPEAGIEGTQLERLSRSNVGDDGKSNSSE